MKVVYVTVRIELEDEVDIEDFETEVDYTFDYPGVVDTELLGVETK